MKPLDLTDPIPGDRLEPPRCVTIKTAAHLLGVRPRQIWEWILSGDLRSVVTDERMVVCMSIEDLIRKCANYSAATLQEILRQAPARPGTSGES